MNIGDTITFERVEGGWKVLTAFVPSDKSPEGGFFFRHTPYKSFDEAVATLKENVDLD